MECIVIDHHTKEDILPNAKFILHPIVSNFGKINLSAGGVSFYLSRVFLNRDDDYLATLGAISTLSDLMELKDYNRELVKMEVNNSGIKCPNCNEGVLVRRLSQKTKKYFWGCSAYPNCSGIFGDDNGKPILEKKEKALRDENSITCPKCNKGFLIERVSQKGFKWLSCSEWKAGCDAKYSRNENGELVEMIFNKN